MPELVNTPHLRTVRLTLTAKHTVPELGRNRGVISLFQELKKDRHPLNADGRTRQPGGLSGGNERRRTGY
ncbi:MAG: hypothetical protein IJC71_02090, partial [Clostridia bacterium]|nr:hypothetical protein [Clostridia bacterium]